MLQRLNSTARTGLKHFYLPDFLEGSLAVDGYFKARLGGRRVTFKGHVDGAWHNGSFVLDETFQYDNGRCENRTWRLNLDEDGEFTSTCSDVIGCGYGRHTDQGCTHGYLFRLPIGRKGFVVRIDEIYLPVDAKTLNYRAALTKLKLPVGEIIMQFRRI